MIRNLLSNLLVKYVEFVQPLNKNDLVFTQVLEDFVVFKPFPIEGWVKIGNRRVVLGVSCQKGHYFAVIDVVSS